MLKTSIIFAAIILGLLQVQSYSQANATVHLIIGYNIPMGDLKGDFDNPQDSLTYLIKNGYSFGFIIKKAYGKGGNFRGTGNLNFSLFSQSKHTEKPEVITDVELQLNIFTAAIGAEWSFAPKRGKLNPFVGAEISLNLYSGSFTFTDDFQDTTEDLTASLTLKPSARIGVQFGGGIDFQIHQSVGFISGVKYCLANLLGKDYVRDNSTEYGLNDKEHYSGSYLRPSRNISFLQIYGGFSYYFGR
jgi:hypothetical protein